MSDTYRPPKRSWPRKFRDAFRGMWRGIRGQSSFVAHFFVAALVIAAGFALNVSRVEWCVLALCITIVLAAEMFNSALESLAKAIDAGHNLHLEDGLDIASGAVLVTAIGAAAAGATVFIYHLFVMLQWIGA